MNIGIIGSGTMGAGIAQVAAMAGNDVHVYDANPQALQRAQTQFEQTLQKLVEKGKITEDTSASVCSLVHWEHSLDAFQSCELVIEAIIENLDIKQEVFTKLEAIVAEHCLLASNTSSLSITSIAAACKHPQRVLGIHFFNPAPLMELVEIVPALQTSADTINSAQSIITSWKKCAVLTKDTPGFIVNRIARPFYSEALRIYDEGIADIETIDEAMRKVGGFRMGPFELMDLIGHDVNYTVTETVWQSFYFDPRYTPSFTQKRLVEAKWYGRKSGRGFYSYLPDASKKQANQDDTLQASIFDRVLLMLMNEAAHALCMQVATANDIDFAMTKGVNYPKGLLRWADDYGIDKIVAGLDRLYNNYHEDRYRCCPLLRRLSREGLLFYPKA